MSMGAGNIVGLKCHGGFYTDVIGNCQYQLVSKGSVYLNIPIIGRVLTICY